MSSNIIISTSKIKACEFFYELCDFCGYEKDWTDRLWGDIVTDPEMYDEFVYYEPKDNHFPWLPIRFPHNGVPGGESLFCPLIVFQFEVVFLQKNRVGILASSDQEVMDLDAERCAGSFLDFFDPFFVGGFDLFESEKMAVSNGYPLFVF